MRINDLVKFQETIMAKILTPLGTEDCLIERGCLGIVIEPSSDEYTFCDVLVGNDIMCNVPLDDIIMIQPGDSNVV
tara:strand:- start:94 stop:321 length:228 start_codon:yes stop_codon:yes gene_type:complete